MKWHFGDPPLFIGQIVCKEKPGKDAIVYCNVCIGLFLFESYFIHGIDISNGKLIVDSLRPQALYFAFNSRQEIPECPEVENPFGLEEKMIAWARWQLEPTEENLCRLVEANAKAEAVVKP